MNRRPRIAVVTPFLDKRHGTERVVAEQIERLSGQYGWDIHIFSQRVEDLHRLERSRQAASAPNSSLPAGDHGAESFSDGSLVWHKVPDVPGPHLVKYLWWFCANHVWRWWARRFRRLRFDLVYSPGINCFDAEVISVHIVFAEFFRQVSEELSLRRNPWRAWPRVVHRRLYYRLIIWLEHILYSKADVSLIAISQKVEGDLFRFYQRRNRVSVSYHGLDFAQFNPENRACLRLTARQALGLHDDWFCLLLIGNDWKKKGLRCLLEAMARVNSPSLRLIVVGRDDPTPFEPIARRLHLEERVFFFPMRSDVQFYYAASDAYVGPSLEDAFALPPAEAMACGLPVIVSRQAGVSEWIISGKDGLILENPADPAELAELICRLQGDVEFCNSIGKAAIGATRQHTWDINARQLREVIEAEFDRKAGFAGDGVGATNGR
jgi:glycosyltransferase involved in cell wall biosynthesis